MGELMVSKTATEAGVDADEAGQYLTFDVGEERLAMSIDAVKEIIETPVITRVPMTPDYIRGVINLRGSVVPVIDLGARLGRGGITLTKRSCIVLVEVRVGEEGHVLGMLVDEVKNILEIPREDIKPPPEFGSEIRTDFIAAMGRLEDVFVIILNVDHVLSIQELAALQALRTEVAPSGSNAQS
ncbi:purine-binding chemotaxis protein CheW [Thiorhodococcus mannitoliphagus]|uniref:Purine-binding chemotaxis protein CheW n=1 Tax=Thiorhodococcus mannitoliphagus TaxID=329406 RepID=A0A6P1E399_9GAMM|nr:chemotaxis protein CheW [Thiorhodococcus mannitoliphagus]NEX23536.1 purine-binding chemotaxis protein CheW [Thiorhodococcus mannitoliphagus]